MSIGRLGAAFVGLEYNENALQNACCANKLNTDVVGRDVTSGCTVVLYHLAAS